MLIDGAPQQVGLAAQRHEYFVKMPCDAELATCSLDAMRESRAEPVGPASDRFVNDDTPALEQQFFNITQTGLKPEMPAHRAADDRRRKAVTVVKRFCIFHHAILLDRLSNVTVPHEHLPRYPAALMISWVISSGWEISERWLALTSMVLAPIRLAMKRWRSGLIVRSSVETA